MSPLKNCLRASDQLKATQRERPCGRSDGGALRHTFVHHLRPADPTDPGDVADLGTRRVSDREFRGDPLLFTGEEGAIHIVFE